MTQGTCSIEPRNQGDRASTGPSAGDRAESGDPRLGAAGVSLERALYRLLHHGNFRAAWRAGHDLDLSPEDRDALATIDPDELERAARLVVRGTIDRQYRGMGGIRDLFARSLAGVPDELLFALVSGFLESEHGDRWHESAGTSIEDAFGAFLGGTPGFDAEIVDDDRCTAVARGLLVGRPSDQRVPSDFTTCPGGWYTVRRRAFGPVLYAATRGRLVKGPITDAIARWIARGSAPAGPARERLVGLGLI